MRVILYCTTNIINKKIYVGVHVLDEPETSIYLGCGVYHSKPSTYNNPKTRFQAAVKKYGPKNFKRVILKEFDNEEDAYFMESEIVDETFIKREDTYNMVLGGNGGDRGINSKICYQYDLDGNYLTEYSSLSKAAEAVHRGVTTISYGIHNKVKAGNFYWSFEKKEKLNLSEYKTFDNKIMVYQYSETGEYDCCYESLSDAARVIGSVTTNISKACKMGYKVKGKYFSYILESNYSFAKKESIKGKKIYQYSLDGHFIAEYNSCSEAEKALNAKRGLSTAIKLGRVFYGFQWSLEKLDSMNPVKKYSKPRKVGQYDLNGNLIKIFNTVSECTKEFSGCRHVLHGRNKTSGGYIFKYIED